MKTIAFPLLFLLFIMSSCASVYNPMDKNKLMKLEVGMTQDQVKNIFGIPDYRGLMDGNEKWSYKYVELTGHSFLDIFFESKKVSSYDSYFVVHNECHSHSSTASSNN